MSPGEELNPNAMPYRARYTRAVQPPTASRMAVLFAGADLADAFSIQLPPNSSLDIEKLARFILSEPPLWLKTLRRMRDILVAGFGIKTSRQLLEAAITEAADRFYIFRVYALYVDEIILGEDDTHLDFRVSILLRSNDEQSNGKNEIVMTTVVYCHNHLGRIYIALISLFHRIVVTALLRRAALRGWPEGGTTITSHQAENVGVTSSEANEVQRPRTRRRV